MATATGLGAMRMADPVLAVQKAIRARLVGTSAITALVPATSILDRNERPAPDPSIILGENQMVDPGITLARDVVRIISTIHVWKKEPSLAGVTAICSAIRTAINARRLDLDAGVDCSDSRFATMRTLRDPDGVTSHGIVVLEVLVREMV